MTMLTVPSLERRLLQTLKEEVEAKAVRDWPPESVELCLVLLREIHARTAGMLRSLEEMLAEGVEARSFARAAAPILTTAEDNAASIREFIDKLSSLEDAASARLLAALQAVEESEKTFCNLLAEALARVSTPPPSMDWDRLKREADADFAAGRLVTFATAEEMFEGLAGSD